MTRYCWLPLVPGKGMSGQPEVYRPLAGGKIACTSPSAASTVRAGGRVNERKNRAGSCLHQTTVHLVRPGIRHRSMAQVQILAGWLCELQNKELLLECDGGPQAGRPGIRRRAAGRAGTPEV